MHFLALLAGVLCLIGLRSEWLEVCKLLVAHVGLNSAYYYAVVIIVCYDWPQSRGQDITYNDFYLLHGIL